MIAARFSVRKGFLVLKDAALLSETATQTVQDAPLRVNVHLPGI